MSKWIRATDKVPPIHIPVLIYTRNGAMTFGKLIPLFDGANSRPMWYGVDPTEDEVTHWMPLPKEPRPRFTEVVGSGDEFDDIHFRVSCDPEGAYNLRQYVDALTDEELLPLAKAIAEWEDEETEK